MNRYWIAIDWGTTNFRAYLMAHRRLIDKVSSGDGLLSILHKDFENTLLKNIQPWEKIIDNNTPIYMAGMVGSQQGWKEVPYVDYSVPLPELSQYLFQFHLNKGNPAFIIPGILGMNRFALPDVMRGEETQLLGVRTLIQEHTLTAVLPGTHSKHIELNGDFIRCFSTVMTGELFSLLNTYSILTKHIPEEEQDEQGFLSGVENGYAIPLNNVLFSARTLLLTRKIPKESVRSYLSGLLIGNEISLLNKESTPYIIGSQHISEKYQKALSHLGRKSTVIDGEDCFIEGMKRICLEK